MNVYVFCIHISVLLMLLPHVLTKTLPEASEIDSEPEENEKSDETETIHEAHHHSLKRFKDSERKELNREKRAFEEGFANEKQCAIMYKNDEPIGILQPSKDGYQLLPIHDDEKIPVEINPMHRTELEEAHKRDTEQETAQELEDEAEETGDNVAPFLDEKYPYIFAKFKIDSRVHREGEPKTKSVRKRESTGPALISEKHANSLRSTLSRIEIHDEAAEAELKGILSDMGLIDDSHIDKREAELAEDEDLEHGTNKIDLIKVENGGERSKRCKSTQKPTKKTEINRYGMIEFPEPNSIHNEESIDQTVNEQADQFNEPEKKGKEKRSENVSEQMERQIRERLQKIKDEVKNEIEKIKANTNGEFDEDDDDGSDDQEENGKSQRKKRNVISNLVDEETSDLDPILVGENNLTPHIRRRRSFEDGEPANREQNDLAKTKEKVKQAIGATKLKIDYSTSQPDRLTKESSLLLDLNVEEVEGNDQQIIKRDKRDLSSNLKMEDDIVDSRKPKKRCGKSSDCPNSESMTSTEIYLATTPDHFLLRNLKEYAGDTRNTYEELNADFESDEDESKTSSNENNARDGRACKCEEKGCKCGGRPKPLVGVDGSNFVYFDGAPMLAQAPLGGQLGESNKASMHILPQPAKKTRPSRQDETNQLSKTETKILKGLRDGGYILDIDPDIYRIIEENPNSLAKRQKRNSFAELVAIHGGGPILNHLVAVRERSMLPKVRRKRLANDDQTEQQQLTLTDMTGEDLFGALPQNFEGELFRYKRVKRG